LYSAFSIIYTLPAFVSFILADEQQKQGLKPLKGAWLIAFCSPIYYFALL